MNWYINFIKGIAALCVFNLHFTLIFSSSQQEKFARSFEAYVYKGKAPNNYLKQVFQNFKEWLRSVYLHITDIPDADISDEVTEMFDRLFSDDGYYQQQKEVNELLKKVKTISRKDKIKNNPLLNNDELDDVQKEHKNACYEIVSAATGKSINYLKTIFETGSNRKSFAKKREAIEMLLDKADDKITINGGFQEHWKKFFSDTGVSYENDEITGDFELFEQALDSITRTNRKNKQCDY